MNSAEDLLVKGMSRVSVQRNEMLERVLLLLDCVEGHRLLTLSRLAEEANLPKASCARILEAMVRHRLLRREGRYYGLGSRVFRYVYSEIAVQPVVRLSRPCLIQLCQETGLASALCIRQGAFRIAIAVEDSGPEPNEFIDAGHVTVAYAGAASKVLMAWLTKAQRDEILADVEWVHLTSRTLEDRQVFEEECQRVRRNGWALSLGERAAGGVAVSVPVIDKSQTVTAALMVTGPLRHMTPTRLEDWRSTLKQAGSRLSSALGYQGTYPHLYRGPSGA